MQGGGRVDGTLESGVLIRRLTTWSFPEINLQGPQKKLSLNKRKETEYKFFFVLFVIHFKIIHQSTIFQ